MRFAHYKGRSKNKAKKRVKKVQVASRRCWFSRFDRVWIHGPHGHAEYVPWFRGLEPPTDPWGTRIIADFQVTCVGERCDGHLQMLCGDDCG